MNEHLLLVEDEPGLRLTLVDRLAAEGYTVDTAADGEAAVRMAAGGAYDLIVLDVMLPRRNGFDVCRDLRQAGLSVPILMLTARGQTADKVVGLKLGADDYVTKPFETMELLARIEALLRRARRTGGGPRPTCFRFGDVRVDVEQAEVRRDGRSVEVSAREFQLLRYLLEHPGVVHSRDRLLNEVWGYDAVPSTRTVDVHVAWLRQKLEPNPKRPQYILTVHGLGYRFAAPEGWRG